MIRALLLLALVTAFGIVGLVWYLVYHISHRELGRVLA